MVTASTRRWPAAAISATVSARYGVQFRLPQYTGRSWPAAPSRSANAPRSRRHCSLIGLTSAGVAVLAGDGGQPLGRDLAAGRDVGQKGHHVVGALGASERHEQHSVIPGLTGRQDGGPRRRWGRCGRNGRAAANGVVPTAYGVIPRPAGLSPERKDLSPPIPRLVTIGIFILLCPNPSGRSLGFVWHATCEAGFAYPEIMSHRSPEPSGLPPSTMRRLAFALAAVLLLLGLGPSSGAEEARDLRGDVPTGSEMRARLAELRDARIDLDSELTRLRASFRVAEGDAQPVERGRPAPRCPDRQLQGIDAAAGGERVRQQRPRLRHPAPGRRPHSVGHRVEPEPARQRRHRSRKRQRKHSHSAGGPRRQRASGPGVRD